MEVYIKTMGLKENFYNILLNRFDDEEINKVCKTVNLDIHDIQLSERSERISAILKKADEQNVIDEMIGLVGKKRPETVSLLRPREMNDTSYSTDQILKLIKEQPKLLSEKEKIMKDFISLMNALVSAADPTNREIQEFRYSKEKQQAYKPFIEGVIKEKDKNFADEIDKSTILFDDFQNFSLSAGTNHLIKDYGILHTQFSANVLGSIALCSSLPSISGESWVSNIETIPNLTNIQSNQDVLAFGSPVSDTFSKLILEYEGEGYQLTRKKNPTIQIPFEYVMHKDLVDFSLAPARRFVAGEEKTMPNWRIRENGKFFPPPKLDERGWISTDYLLITRLPNFLTRKAFLSGSQVLVIGGTHGVGTYAIKNLISQSKMLKEIRRRIHGKPYYQILLPIESIDHELVQTENGLTLLSHAQQLGNPIVRTIDVDDEKILKRI